MNGPRALLAAGAATVIGAGAAGAATISTLGTEDTFFAEWGLPVVDRFGQTMTLDSAATVRSFTFRIDDEGTAISYVAELFAWDGFNTVGGALASVAGATAGNDAVTDYVADIADTLVGVGEYALAFRATSPGAAAWAMATTNPYADGNFVLGIAGEPLGDFEPAFDAAFAVTFDEVAPVPLPAALPLLSAALGGLGLLARRRLGRAPREPRAAGLASGDPWPRALPSGGPGG